MNKLTVIICIVISAFAVNAGLSINEKFNDLSKKKENMKVQSRQIEIEISEKQALSQESPVTISKAFGLVVNEIRFLEEYGGTTMNLSIEKSKDNDDISNYYVKSQYRGVNKLSILIQIEKFSNETDMAAVLNDIYQLEAETDFKVNEINKAGNTLIVKGDVYGL